MRSRITAAVSAGIFLLGVSAAWADPDGEAVFKRSCGPCHSITPGQNRVGPSLAGVVGRKSGSVAGYLYSTANTSSGATWDADTLDKYLTDPRAFIPGTKMTFVGLKDPADRQAVITYLKAN